MRSLFFDVLAVAGQLHAELAAVLGSENVFGVSTYGTSRCATHVADAVDDGIVATVVENHRPVLVMCDKFVLSSGGIDFATLTIWAPGRSEVTLLINEVQEPVTLVDELAQVEIAAEFPGNIRISVLGVAEPPLDLLAKE